MAAYYNEIDPYAAQWLRNLIAAGHIAPGVVDERSIEDVTPDDLRPYTQCHFFAGVGVWSFALRRAGWPDDLPVWTGSCPCQPFSAAGKSAGFDDERHLWPAFHWLIEQCKPPVVFGEQVASKDAEPWIDLVSTDLEGLGFTFGAIAFPSAGVGAPHIRDRAYWVADSADKRQHGRRASEAGNGRDAPRVEPERLRDAGGLGYADEQSCKRFAGSLLGAKTQEHGKRGAVDGSELNRPEYASEGLAERLADLHSNGRNRAGECFASTGSDGLVGNDGAIERQPASSPTNGLWRAADWLLCRDGKWRPVEASPQPLADGSAESLGRVRAEVIAEIEKEINASTMEREIRSAETLRALWCALRAQASRVWTLGRIPGLHEAPFLLAFLRQLTEQGWGIEKGVSLSCAQTSCGQLRSVRHDIGVASASCERGLEGQPTRELADAVHFLSSLLARHAHSAWGDAYAAYAEIGFPLGHNAPSRVGRLRAYGNAINAEAAQAFIEAYLQART